MKFKIGQTVRLSEKALKRTKKVAMCLDGSSKPELDPIAQFATGVVTAYNGGYDVTWDNDDGIYITGLYDAWWPAEDLAKCTEEERREMTTRFLSEKQLLREKEAVWERQQIKTEERRKELMNGFQDTEHINQAAWLFDHEQYGKDLFLDAYYLLNADLPEELKMKDGIHIDLPADLRVLHKISVRALSLRMAWGSCGFHRGFDVQYIFETDKTSAVANMQKCYRGSSAIAFILPTGDGDWHITYMRFNGETQWAGKNVYLKFKCTLPGLEVEEPQEGFDTMLKKED